MACKSSPHPSPALYWVRGKLISRGCFSGFHVCWSLARLCQSKTPGDESWEEEYLSPLGQFSSSIWTGLLSPPQSFSHCQFPSASGYRNNTAFFVPLLWLPDVAQIGIVFCGCPVGYIINSCFLSFQTLRFISFPVWSQSDKMILRKSLVLLEKLWFLE